jgi:protein-S-isoprenylcysteine O-methyltransferase Ste14
MYFALLAIFWVGPVMSWGRFEFALVGTLYLFIGSRFEERNLRRELGTAYDLYCAHVPMWIPRLTPWHYPSDTL